MISPVHQVLRDGTRERHETLDQGLALSDADLDQARYLAYLRALLGWLEALRTELLHSGVHVMWVSPGYTTSNIRNVALNNEGNPEAESLMDEDKMMSAEDCAREIFKAIEQKKRSLVLTGTGKRTLLINRLFPSLADKLIYKFFFKGGQLIK